MAGVPPRVLIIGASASIGNALVKRFSDAGSYVLATYNRTPLKCEEKPRVTTAQIDLTSSVSMDSIIKDPVAIFGKIDVAVFLSGILPGKSLTDYDDALVQDVMSINFIGQVAFLRRLMPYLGEGASIFFVSSIAGDRGSYDPIYAASKAAQNALVKSLATWLAPAIRVNAIAPALISDSRMFQQMEPARRQHHLSQTPTNRLTNKDEVAGAIFDLCGPAWSNLNGQVIGLNGGVHG